MGLGLGGFINSITGASHSAKQSFKYSGALAEQNWKYQKEMAQNAHQWEVADLQKAGLNPILSAGGSGASAGGAGGGGSVGMQAGAGGMSDLINSAGGLMKLASELELIDSQKDNIDADTTLKGAVTGKTKEETRTERGQGRNWLGTIRDTAGKLLNNSAKQLNKNYKDKTNKGAFSKEMLLG